MCDPFDLGCVALSGLGSAFEGIAAAAGAAAANMVAQALTFWVSTPSVNPDSAVIRQLQGYTMPVVALMLVASILVQAIRMTLSRKKDPAINVAVGLLRFAVVNAVGLATVGLALRAGDALAESLVNQGIAGYAQRMQVLFAVEVLTDPFGLLVLALIALLLGVVQWVIAILRHAALLVLAAMMLLAASGAINESTKGWSGKLWSWQVALIAYKPAAALIYTVGFTFMGTGQDITTIATGIAVLFLAVVALPVMLKFFSWSGVGVSGGSGVGGVVAAGALGAVALASMRGGGAAASAQARERTGPGSSPAGAQASAGGSTGPGLWGGGPGATGSGPGGPRTATGGAPAAAAGEAAAAPGVTAAARLAQGAQQAGQAAAATMATPPVEEPRRGPGGAGP